MQVSNRHCFADPQLYHQLAPELLALYRRPLHVQGWDVALIEVRVLCFVCVLLSLSAWLRWRFLLPCSLGVPDNFPWIVSVVSTDAQSGC